MHPENKNTTGAETGLIPGREWKIHRAMPPFRLALEGLIHRSGKLGAVMGNRLIATRCSLNSSLNRGDGLRYFSIGSLPVPEPPSYIEGVMSIKT